jgi:type I restriction-modification system DNA methylase subunit
MNQINSVFKSLEDIMRNGVSKLTINDAFQEITNLLLLKLIESKINDGSINELSDKDTIKIDKECIFSKIHEKYCIDYENKIKNKDIKKGELYKLLFDESRHKSRTFNEKLDAWVEKDDEDYTKMCIFKKIFHHEGLSEIYKSSWKKYFRFEEKDEPDIVKCMDKINEAFSTFNIHDQVYDVLGDAFEKYRDGVFGAKSGLGQYFTSQFVVEKILLETDIKPTDKIFDPACGAGGFFIKAYKYIKSKHGEKIANKFAQNNIYGIEVDPNIFKVLQLNAYIYGFKLNNFKLSDSIGNYNLDNNDMYDALTYNPPFGASIDAKKKFPINIKNSSGLFLQLGFKVLKPNGRCGVVVDQGIINNGVESVTSWQGKIRKELLNNGLKKIILLPVGTFQYAATFAICVLIYDKSYTGKKIIYEQGYFKKEDKGIRLKEMHFNLIGTITYEQVETNKYSLKSDDYFKIKEVKQDMDQWIKLGDVIVEENGGEVISKLHFNKGCYNLYSCSNDIMKTDYANFPEKKLTKKGDLLLPRNGSQLPLVKIPEIGTLYTNVVSRIHLNNNLNYKYVYYYLNLTIQLFMIGDEANSIPSYNMDKWKNRLIPNIPLDHQTEIVEFLDKYFEKNNMDEFIKYVGRFNIFSLLTSKRYNIFDDLQSYIQMIKKSEELITNQDWKLETKKKYLKIIIEGYDIINTYYNNKSIELLNELFKDSIVIMTQIENIPKKKNYYIQSLFDSIRSKSQMMKLGDIVEFKNYKSVKIENASKTGKYPFYNCSIVGHLWSDEYLYEDEVLIMNKTNGSGKCHIFYNNGPFTISGGVIIFKSKEQLNIIYLHNYLNSYKYKISNMFVGGDKKNINICTFKNLEIPVPPLNIQEEIINKINKLNEQSSHYDTYAKVIQTELDNITETIQNMTQNKI